MSGSKERKSTFLRSSLWALGGALLASGGLGWWVLGEPPPAEQALATASPPSEEPEGPTAADARANIEKLERMQRRARALLTALQAAQGQAGELRERIEALEAGRALPPQHWDDAEPSEAEGDPAAEAEARLSEGESEQAERERQQWTALQSLHRAEGVDRDWSAQMDRQFEDLFQQDEQASGNRLEQVDCRTSHCRLLVQHERAEGSRELSASMLDSAFRGGLMARRAADSSATELFVFRPGHREVVELAMAGTQAADQSAGR